MRVLTAVLFLLLLAPFFLACANMWSAGPIGARPQGRAVEANWSLPWSNSKVFVCVVVAEQTEWRSRRMVSCFLEGSQKVLLMLSKSHPRISFAVSH